MDTIVIGATIKHLREKKGITQAELAETIGVTDKAVSKWETAKGLPDITLMEPLAKALGVSLSELMYRYRSMGLGVEPDHGLSGNRAADRFRKSGGFRSFPFGQDLFVDGGE